MLRRRRDGVGRRRSRFAPGDLDVGDGAEGMLPGVGGAGIWYRVHGEGPQTVLVPCCGNDGDLGSLGAPGRRVVFYDSRNRGRSETIGDPAQLGFSAEVGDVAAVRAALGIDRCVLFGWSYHAGVVSAHAIENPDGVEAVVLAAPIAPRSGTATRAVPEPPPADLARLDQMQASGLPHDDPEAWCTAWRQVYVARQMADPASFERLAPVCHLPNERPDHVVRAVVAVLGELGTYDWRGPLGALAVPTLVIHGDEDTEPVDSAYEWAAAVRRGTIEVIDRAGRYPWVERPVEFFAAVDSFLAAVGTGDGP